MNDKSLVDFHKSSITISDIQRMENFCYDLIRDENLYYLRNDAKLRAVCTTANYDEFKDIVDAAHLCPINKKDKTNAHTKNRLWNSAAKADDEEEDN